MFGVSYQCGRLSLVAERLPAGPAGWCYLTATWQILGRCVGWGLRVFCNQVRFNLPALSEALELFREVLGACFRVLAEELGLR